MLTTPPGPAELLLVSAINEVLDVHTVRIAALFDKLPEVVMLMLSGIASASLAVTGFIAGIHGRMSRWRMMIFAMVLAGVMLVIVDYDRPGNGFIRTKVGSLLVLVQDMETDLGIQPMTERPPER